MKSLVGTLIRRERLRKNYSQEGLCQGICVVSYLSKIELGQAQAGEDILKALLNRLDLDYETDEAFLRKAQRKVDGLYEALYEGIFSKEALTELEAEKGRYLSSDYMLDALLFSSLSSGSDTQAEELKEYAPCMNARQYELYLYLECLQGRESFDALLLRNPNGFYLGKAGYYQWAAGNFLEAVELLNRSYLVSSQEGMVTNMLHAKLILGNCYSSMRNKELMLKHYGAAEKIARVMKKQAGQAEYIPYNIAATLLEWGEPLEALVYFEKCRRKDAMYYHKYAICMERLGKEKEAERTLRKGRSRITREAREEYGDHYEQYEALYGQMYDLVEYRLRHKGYLMDTVYEELLRDCMKGMEKLLPKGYERFHVPYLMELLESQRKYKEAYLLMKEFSI